MKKLLFSSILGLAALGMWATPSHAWTFGLIPHHCCLARWCGCNRYSATIRVTPYNAFSPVASGHMCFDGCSPFCCAPSPGFCPPGYPGAYPGPGPGYYPPEAESQCLPPCDGCPTESCAPGAAPGPNPPGAPAANPGPATQRMPYNGPLQAAAPYGYAPMMPQYVTPVSAQPNYWTAGYGR